MKGAFLATAAAALVGTALADGAHRRHAHEPFHQRRAVQAGASSASASEETCGCTTEVVTVWGTPTLVPVSTATETVVSEVVTTLHSTSYTTVTVVATPGESAGTVPAGGSSGEASTTTPEGVEATGVTGATGATGVPAVETTSAPAAVETTSAPAAVVETTSSAPAAVETTSAPAAVVETTSTPAAAVPTSSAVVLPTPDVTTFASTGVYTIPASTVTVSETTQVVTPAVTTLASGTHTIGGVTTIVETSTTIVCPYATVKPSGTTVTSVIEHTTYYCPAAGTYTIAPTTTYVPSSAVVTYPAVSTVTPGVYSHTAEVVTVTVTDYTYTCPFSGSTSSAAVAVTTPSAAAATTTVVPATTAAPATSSVKASTVSSAAASSSSAAATTGVSATGLMGMTYTPYTNDNGCKTTATMTSDIKTIAAKGFTHIRLYSTDCNTLEVIGELAEELGLKLILGVYISSTGTSGAESQVTAITEWGKWELVSLIVVGNEAVSSGYTDASSLASFITSCKTTFTAAGYTGQITTTEPVDIWQEYGASYLCSAVDILGANIHPFFNAETTAEEAGTFATAEFTLLKKICSGLSIINLETGWPSQGNANGAAVPGASEQATAIKAIREAVGGDSVFFSYANDLWKSPGEFDVEQYWGCIDQF